MRVLLIGQKSFGATVLRMLIERGHDVAGVWSPEDDALTHAARQGHCWIYQTERTAKHVRMLGVDLIVTAHSHDLVPQSILEAARLGGVGYHPSLLPRHRGRDAVRWTVRLREPITGGSVYWLTDELDGGPIAAQDWCFVRPEWSASDLWRNELFPMGIRLLARVLDDVRQNRIVAYAQDTALATWEPAITIGENVTTLPYSSEPTLPRSSS
jgi:methionyl-tRNA formyltransferase